MRFVALLIPLILGVKVLHLIVIIQGRMVCLICTPDVRGSQAFRLRCTYQTDHSYLCYNYQLYNNLHRCLLFNEQLINT